MAIFRRFFGSRMGDDYTEGIALFEQGRFTEAAARLRAAGGLDDHSPRGSLAGFYLRKALLQEGRRYLSAGDMARALAELRDAARTWPEFPDLQFLCGAAAGLTGDWPLALSAAREALRHNPDYCEARLLEASALQALGRAREAAASLNALIESGRRVNHRLIEALQRRDSYREDNLPDDLLILLRVAATGDGVKDRLAQAIATCQAGEWESGLAQLAALAAEQPRFPDVRAKHAAALFQVGRLDDALLEVDAALAVNPHYRTAVILKGLILSDRGELAAAREFLASILPQLHGTAGRHEEIFLAYLRGVLAYLLGDTAACRELLSGWEDLPHLFARAALLVAACDDLDGLPDRCAGRLDELATIWSADAELVYFAIAQAIVMGQFDRADVALTHWPAGASPIGDLRPWLLRGRLALARGRAPDLPSPLPVAQAPDQPRAAAWRQLAAARAVRGGEPQTAREICEALLADGTADEETGRLWLQAALAGAEPPAGDPPATPIADSWLPGICWLLRRQNRAAEAERLVACRRAARPDCPRWWWLGADFWLAPVRRWIS